MYNLRRATEEHHKELQFSVACERRDRVIRRASSATSPSPSRISEVETRETPVLVQFRDSKRQWRPWHSPCLALWTWYIISIALHAPPAALTPKLSPTTAAAALARFPHRRANGFYNPRASARFPHQSSPTSMSKWWRQLRASATARPHRSANGHSSPTYILRTLRRQVKCSRSGQQITYSVAEK